MKFFAKGITLVLLCLCYEVSLQQSAFKFIKIPSNIIAKRSLSEYPLLSSKQASMVSLNTQCHEITDEPALQQFPSHSTDLQGILAGSSTYRLVAYKLLLDVSVGSWSNWSTPGPNLAQIQQQFRKHPHTYIVCSMI